MEPNAEITHEECLQLLSDLANSAPSDPQEIEDFEDDLFPLLPIDENVPGLSTESIPLLISTEFNEAAQLDAIMNLDQSNLYEEPSTSLSTDGLFTPTSLDSENGGILSESIPKTKKTKRWTKEQREKLKEVFFNDSKYPCANTVANLAAKFGVDAYNVILWFTWKRSDSKRWAKRILNKLDLMLENTNDLSAKDQKSLTQVLYVAPELYEDWIEGKETQLRASIERFMETSQSGSLRGINSKESKSILHSESDILSPDQVKDNPLTGSKSTSFSVQDSILDTPSYTLVPGTQVPSSLDLSSYARKGGKNAK